MNFELKKELCKQYKFGDSLRKLSIKYRIPRSTIYDNLNKFNVIRRHILIKNLQNYNEFLIGTFVGLWAGDGSKFLDKKGKYTIKIHLNKNDNNLINFIKYLYIKIFGKEPKLYFDGGNRRNNASLKIDSKFVYYFLDNYLYYKNRKTHTVGLKGNIENHSGKFLKGFLLGLVLSDSYLKNTFVFSTVSKNLAKNMISILKIFNLEPRYYISNNREWKPVYRISIRKSKFIVLKTILNDVLRETGIEKDVSVIKYNL